MCSDYVTVCMSISVDCSKQSYLFPFISETQVELGHERHLTATGEYLEARMGSCFDGRIPPPWPRGGWSFVSKEFLSSLR